MDSRVKKLLKALRYSSCNYLAVDYIEKELQKKGFQELYQDSQWELSRGGRYYMKKNGSAIFAFTIGISCESFQNGALLISAHSDSPCLKLKPHPEIYGEGGVVSLNVEKYGGGILNTWFDRPLSMSGRVVEGNDDDPLHPREILFDLDRPIAIIPNLAIHFNRQINDGYAISVQKDMRPVVGYFNRAEIEEAKAHGGFIKKTIAKELEIPEETIIDYDISLYPMVDATLGGLNEEYVISPRLDDLSMAFAGLEALSSTCEEENDKIRILAIFDNEETGSGTRQGAASPVLRDMMERINDCMGGNKEAFHVGIANSFLISADNAHAWHPNYNEKYDPTNHPVIGGGPVIKINANSKYMTDGVGSTVFKTLCNKAGVKYQMFVNHSDVAGGSTLGNILTSQLDLNGVDVGTGIWGMHSAVETGGIQDWLDMEKVFELFWKI